MGNFYPLFAQKQFKGYTVISYFNSFWIEVIQPIASQNLYSDLKYSTDVGDVSWIVPTVHLNIPTFAAGTALHSWQAVAQGKSSIAHKGMLYAAKIMSLTALDFLQNPELANQARKELTETLDGETYPNPLPKDLKPELW